MQFLRHSLVLHAAGEGQPLGLVGITASDTRAGTGEDGARRAGGYQRRRISGEFRNALTHRFAQVADRNIALGGVVHGLEHFLRYQRSAEVGVCPGSVDDGTQSNPRVHFHGVLRGSGGHGGCDPLPSGQRGECGGDSLEKVTAVHDASFSYGLYSLSMLKTIVALTALALSVAPLPAAEVPQTEISNGPIRATIYLPDAKNGFYRGTRFDWSGVVYSLRYQGHEFYGPWFSKTDPKVHDFVHEGSDIIAGPCSATTGPADEFGPLGWDAAKPGGSFVKIGVGALRKPEDSKYDAFRLYEIADAGKWTVQRSKDSVVFTQDLADSSSGYGYHYRKAVRLTAGKPEMVLEHSLTNKGTRVIDTT